MNEIDNIENNVLNNSIVKKIAEMEAKNNEK